jgi:hypothetical protein
MPNADGTLSNEERKDSFKSSLKTANIKDPKFMGRYVAQQAADMARRKAAAKEAEAAAKKAPEGGRRRRRTKRNRRGRNTRKGRK